MEYIDMKFKDAHPEQTVERIRALLRDVGLEIQEKWHNSGIENCQSVNLYVNGVKMFGSNGKGITRELARASAYGEFIERLQCGMQRHKYQTQERDPEIYLHGYAPDGKYMTLEEIEENGEWMDHLIRTYPFLTKKKLAKFCKNCAFTDTDKVLCVPFYSVFEDKYVYIPVGYMEIMYTANGCCAGNTREEAWLHALSEIFERHNHVQMMNSKKPAPKFSEAYLRQFPTISKILDAVQADGNCILEVMDFSCGTGFPVVASRLIDKKSHGYLNIVAADPVVEIAIERSMTELFQGRSLTSLYHNKEFLDEKNIPMGHNIINQLNVGYGLYPLDYFAEELTCDQQPAQFPDNSGRTNPELLRETLERFKKMGFNVYVRNFSYLGFDCYKFVIPGFSETRASMFQEIIPEYFLGYAASKTLRNMSAATNTDLQYLLTFHNKIRTLAIDHKSFQELAGISFNPQLDYFLVCCSLAYANYKLGKVNDAIVHLNRIIQTKELPEELRQYYHCVIRYMQLQKTGKSEQIIRAVLRKFYDEKLTDRLFGLVDAGGTPYDADLLNCDPKNCANCNYRESCSYNAGKDVIRLVGKVYERFTDGQKKENFVIQ